MQRLENGVVIGRGQGHAERRAGCDHLAISGDQVQHVCWIWSLSWRQVDYPTPAFCVTVVKNSAGQTGVCLTLCTEYLPLQTPAGTPRIGKCDSVGASLVEILIRQRTLMDWRLANSGRAILRGGSSLAEICKGAAYRSS
jgi:hypothetical protein